MYLIGSSCLAKPSSWRSHEVSWSVAVNTAGWSAAAAAPAAKSGTLELVMIHWEELQHHGQKQHATVKKTARHDQKQ